jgi:hypothetical protein
MSMVHDVFVIHPRSATEVIQIIDTPDNLTFEERWAKTSIKAQAEFGWDLPIWDTVTCGRIPRTIIPMTFDTYVNLVERG